MRRGAGPGKRLRATLLGSLDLKPGYRLFETVPPPAASEAARNSDSVTLDVNGKAPYGERKSLLFFFLLFFVFRCSLSLFRCVHVLFLCAFVFVYLFVCLWSCACGRTIYVYMIYMYVFVLRLGTGCSV